MRNVICLIFIFICVNAQHTVKLPLEKSDFVTLKAMFRIGSINDPVGKEGLTKLTAQMLSDGASIKYSLEQKADLLFPMGAGFNVTVDKEAVVFTGEVHKDHLQLFYDIFKQSLLHNKFDENDFKRVKTNQLNHVSTSVINTNDEALSKRVLERELFTEHPYSQLVEGTTSGIEAITINDVQTQFNSYFTKNNLVLGIAGGYTQAFLNAFETDFNALPEGKKGLIDLPKTKSPKGIEVTVVEKPNTYGSAIFMGFPMNLTRTNDDFAAMMVMNSWFGEHRKSYSHLYQKMREDRSLNYGDYSYIEWYPSGHSTQLPFTGTPRRDNYFAIWIRPVQIAKQLASVRGKQMPEGNFVPEASDKKLYPESMTTPELGQAHFVIRQALYELNKLIENGLSEEDFQLTRDFVRGYIKQYIRTQELRLGYLMDSFCYGRTDFISEMDALLAKLTRDDVNKAIKKYLSAENMYVAVVTDPSEAKPLMAHIKKGKRSPIIYKPDVFTGLSKELLEEDIEILKYSYKRGQIKSIKSETLFK